MKFLLNIFIIISVLVTYYQASGQNRPLIEFSTALSPHFMLGAESESSIGPSFPTSINYIYNSRLTFGAMLVFENLPSEHVKVDYTMLLGETDYYGYNNGELEDDWYVATGIGFNIKYNFILHKYFSLYSQIQANYVAMSTWDDRDKEWDSENLQGNVIHTYKADPLPFEGQQAVTLNLNFGADVKVSKTVSLYFQYDMRDVFNSLNIYYDLGVYNDEISTNPNIYNVSDVNYTEATNPKSIRTLHMGIRFYLFDRKF